MTKKESEAAVQQAALGTLKTLQKGPTNKMIQKQIFHIQKMIDK